MQEQNTSNQPSSDTTSLSEQYSPPTNRKEANNNISAQSTLDKPCTCGKEGCPSCNSESGGKMFHHSYVYAIGKVVHRFPNKSLELELAQAIGRGPQEEIKGRTHEEAFHKVITDPAN